MSKMTTDEKLTTDQMEEAIHQTVRLEVLGAEFAEAIIAQLKEADEYQDIIADLHQEINRLVAESESRLREADLIESAMNNLAKKLTETENERDVGKARWLELKDRLRRDRGEKAESARFPMRVVLDGVLGDMNELEKEKS